MTFLASHSYIALPKDIAVTVHNHVDLSRGMVGCHNQCVRKCT